MSQCSEAHSMACSWPLVKLKSYEDILYPIGGFIPDYNETTLHQICRYICMPSKYIHVLIKRYYVTKMPKIWKFRNCEIPTRCIMLNALQKGKSKKHNQHYNNECKVYTFKKGDLAAIRLIWLMKRNCIHFRPSIFPYLWIVVLNMYTT